MVDSTQEENAPASGTEKRPSSWLSKSLLAAAALVLVVGGVWLLHLSSGWGVKIAGIGEHPVTPSAVSDGAIQVRGESVNHLRAYVDGRPVSVHVGQGHAEIRPEDLADGRHELRISVPSVIPLLGDRSFTEQFTVDGTAPQLATEKSLSSESFDAPVTVSGTAEGAARVTVAGNPVPLDKSGKFTTSMQQPPATIPVVASDRAGNRTAVDVTVNVTHPGMRAVHMTGHAWTSDQLREPVLQMAREGKIDTVELDIKDESGEIPYDSQVPLANKIGADKGYYDARKVIDKLHSMGVRVVGRLVAFKDPILAEASWQSGHRERVVQTAGGGAYNGGYGNFSFTNFANPAVRQYNIDIAAEAAALGFDDILYDYVRRPDGNIDSMRFAGLESAPGESIASFLQQTRERIREHDTFLGACVFGITVTRPESVGQNIPMMAEHLDYVAPMIYPSHWGPGEYGVANPNREPYKIVHRSLQDWREAVRGTNTQVFPWLQDFSLGVAYGPEEVKAQITASRDNGIDSFLLWSPACRYTTAALSARP
ncbi:hypothetical protein DFQ14_1115 [Halopolyspora algeriensis]|uniref:DUF4015 domain-containing protein n=1 Tax=Halopolyspora algeriensis TaxID=1500506 RepID=A0A368VJE6_9ACTN|nr:putative glycoside hydrolase [Halopolyspora algeriensis]RCW40356.1 hypothetical protein DFQ14_1115 [Halopolyspora algeriensis]TQM53641.1 hypothetical protein FHU43_1802 [Halopolyspora algeriensis]